MFDTNALLTIAFSIISNFTSVVAISPLTPIPQKPEDLSFWHIGGPRTPVWMYLVHRQGTLFWIGRGAVEAYASPGSYFRLQDPALLPAFTGTTTLTTNDIIAIAEKALRPLIKSGNPLAERP